MTSMSGIWRIAFVSFAYHEIHLETQIEDLHSIQTSIQSANRSWHSTVGALKLLSVAGGVESRLGGVSWMECFDQASGT